MGDIDNDIKASSTNDSDKAVLSWTSIAPTWSDSKQGYYDATETNRYLGGCYKADAVSWENKYTYLSQALSVGLSTGVVTIRGDLSCTGTFYANQVLASIVDADSTSFGPSLGIWF